MRNSGFLPVNTADMGERGWSELDFLIISGDAYVDHPSFGAAIIARVLENLNYRVGIIAQPEWQNLEAFRIMGKPRLACLIAGGNLDSMVNHYTAARKKRSRDAYSPGGQTGLRPDRATIVYSNRVREALPGVPVIIGGIEASLRRFAHYDYWSNRVRRSLLLDSQAELLVYGMGEKPIAEIAGRLAAGENIQQIQGVAGTVVPWRKEPPEGAIVLPDYQQVQNDKLSYAEAFWVQYQQQDPVRGKILYQKHDREGVLQYPPASPLSRAEMDRIYALPYMGTYHPRYQEMGGVPAIEEVEFSIVSSRGCYGGCSFCALVFHQGRIVQSRSQASIIREAERLSRHPHFKGYIHDVGGPTANFRHPSCQQQLSRGTCPQRQCLFPHPCEKLDSDQSEYIDLLRRLRELPGIKKVFVRSGVRYDTILVDRKSDLLLELCQHHISGQLKVAPEHVSAAVLKYMGKPGKQVYENFVRRFQKINQKIEKKQYLIPYLMSSHPGSSLREAIELAEYVRDMRVNPEQVQDFIPTPGTLSTCMYYTELDPRTMEKVYVPKSLHEKAMQRALIQYRNPQNYELVKEALILAHREDLIGFGPRCLIKPWKIKSKSQDEQNSEQRASGRDRKKGKQCGRGQTKRKKTLPGMNKGHKHPTL